MAAVPHAAEMGPPPQRHVAPSETEARVIVKFKAGSAMMRALAANPGPPRPQQANALGTRIGMALRDGRVLGPRIQVVTGAGLRSQALADRLAAESDVEFAVVDLQMHALGIVPNDALYAASPSIAPVVGQWYLRAPNSSAIVDSTSVLASINVEPAWAITLGTPDVVVAVLDTGVRREHPDLMAKLLPGYDFVTDTTRANDGGGRDPDPTDPGDYGCPGATNQTSTWHGTQTSGLVGASTDNAIGMAGVGRGVMVLPVRVLGRCGGASSDIQAALLWAAGIPVDGVPDNPNPAKVINMSFGSTSATACGADYVDALSRVAAVGAVVVAAAGNEGLAVGTPASCAGVIAVAGVRHAGTKVAYSDLGPAIAIAAPAGNCVNTSGTCLYPILTTSNSGSTTPVASIYTGDGANRSLGTSFSAPLVAGTAALMLSANPGLTPAQVLSAIQRSARSFPTSGSGATVAACAVPAGVAQDECYCTTTTCGAGLLDAGAAVALVSTPSASIASSAGTVVAGEAIVLNGSRSQSIYGITGYQWTITSGAASASFSGPTNVASVTLATSAAGSVAVTLTVTDAKGKQASSSVVLQVSAAPVPVATSGGGGGALGFAWLLALVAATLAVRLTRAARSARTGRAGH